MGGGAAPGAAVASPAATSAAASEPADSLFARLVEFRDLLVGDLGGGEAVIAELPPQPGDRVLDLGGDGETTRRLACLVGSGGTAIAVDASELEVIAPEGPFDLIFSRLGLGPLASRRRALGQMRAALRPGGRLCAVHRGEEGTAETVCEALRRARFERVYRQRCDCSPNGGAEPLWLIGAVNMRTGQRRAPPGR